ncbi:MAG: flagellar biosynthetic protein FliO [Acidobacteriaceae bacterium]|jgi:flagellar biosynthesis protein FliO
MIVKIRIPRLPFSGSRAGLTPVAAGAGAIGRGATFSATLSDCMDDWVVRQAPGYSAEAARPAVARAAARKPRKQAGPSGLARAFSWLQSKYAMTATKRLRVAETVSLGEKRFVALVCVEGREFLVGGGSAGVLLLAQLGAAGCADGKRLDLVDGEDTE